MSDDILKRSNGANFYLADLHIHTPHDKRFKCPPGIDPATSEGKKAVADEYIKSAVKNGVQFIGITEHNDVSWIDPIREAAKGTNITIFPGFELSADSGAGGIHIIALFEPDSDVTSLDDIITQVGLPRKSRFHSDGSPKLANKQLNELVDFIADNGGICIAAHVLNDHGILKKQSMKGEPRVNAWKNQKLLAAEIPIIRSKLTGFEKKAFENSQDLYKRKRKIASIYSSDARSFNEIGSRATWIKISSKTIGGLKQAFLDWESRIRHNDELTKHRFTKILTAEWQGGFLDGTKIHFNKNLNCLIGGKGTGKSTVLETLRFAFGKEFVPKAEKALEQHQEILKEVFKKGSKIVVIVEAHHPTPKKYIIERTFNQLPIVKDEYGALLHDLKPCDVIAIESYGQKEIYEISRDARFQLSLIDRFLGDKLDKLSNEEDIILSQIEENKIEYLKFKNEIEGLDEQIARLPKLEEQLKRYKDSGLPQKLKEKSKYEEEQLFIEQAKKNITNVKKHIEKIKEKTLINDPLPLIAELGDFPNKKLLAELKAVIKEAQDSVDKYFKKIEEAISKADTSVSGENGIVEKWEKQYDAQEKRYQEIIVKLEEEFPGIDAEEFIEKEKEINRLKPLKATKKDKKKELDKIQKHRTELLTKLYDNRREQFSIRDKTCKDIIKRLEGILVVSVEYEGDRVVFFDLLKKLKSGAQQLDKIVESDNFSVPSFVDAVRQGPVSVAKVFGITPNSASNLCASISEKALLEIEPFKVDTRTTIKLNIGTKESPKYQSTEKLSVGQKCTAILTLILLESTNPLIIDQPEDDLDNTFIFSDIVKKLRQEKEKRQFVIATHNANIPVLGDAELICVLSADADYGYIEKDHYGSIDDPSVREPVETILEGGREAFQLRKEKYGF